MMDQAAMLLGLWTRHTRRILAACGKDGAAVRQSGSQTGRGYSADAVLQLEMPSE